MAELKHAIIGCGRIAQNHYNAAKENNIDIVCCCDRDLEKAKAFANKNKIPKYVEDYRDLINNKEIDSVSICTDHLSHTQIAKDFLGKKHIIIEKPLSTNIELANEFIDKNPNNKVVTVISQHRFDYPVNLVKKILDSGDLGKITLVNAKLRCFRPNEYYTQSYWRGNKIKEGGSTVINQSYHIVDTIVYLFGMPNEVKSFSGNFKYKQMIETEDTCASILKYDNMLCTFSSTNTSILDWKTSIEIIGTKGEITFTIDFPEEILEFNADNVIKEKYSKEIEKVNVNFENYKDLAVNYYGLSHNNQFEDFKVAIQGKKEIKVGLAQALETQKLIEMIYN
mgnify:CR=1 FL=1